MGDLLRLHREGAGSSVVLQDPRREAFDGLVSESLTLEGVYETFLLRPEELPC